MGKNDVAVKNWLSDKVRFADFCNGILFQGNRIVLPEELEKENGEENLLLTDKQGKTEAITKYRDIVMKWKQGVHFVLLACESQDAVHYAMVIRNMIYDSLSYTKQINRIRKNRERERKEGKKISLTGAEFLSGFQKEDVLYPVITFVFYYKSEPWDGNLDLHHMFPEELNEENRELLQKYVPNYWINLVDVMRMEHVERFQTDLEIVFQMLKCQNDKKKMGQYMIQEKEKICSLEKETVDLLQTVLNIKGKLEQLYDGKKEEERMCKAWDDWREDGVREGIEKGKKEGIKEGESWFAQLNLILLKDGRYEELKQVSLDSDYRQKLYQEYGIA